jgi:hypothetical protein
VSETRGRVSLVDEAEAICCARGRRFTQEATPAVSKPIGRVSAIRRFASYCRPHRRLSLVDFGCAVLSRNVGVGFSLSGARLRRPATTRA